MLMLRICPLNPDVNQSLEPGTELFSQGATPQVSLPRKRFTAEFGMESEWYRIARSTRNVEMVEEPSRLHSKKLLCES